MNEFLHWPKQHHIRYIGRLEISQFNDKLGGVDLKCTQWVQFRSTQPKLYFPKIMEFSHYVEYGVKPYLLLSATRDEILSWMIDMYVKIHLVSDSNSNI